MFVQRLNSILLPLLFVLSSGIASAQMTGLWVETVVQHDGIIGNTDFSGLTTYRLHAVMTSESDFLGASFGNAATPCSISTSTSFYQHPAGGSFGTDISDFFTGILPDLSYDSWLTIGLEAAPQAGNGDGISTIGMGDELVAFESGSSLEVESQIGGSWFVLPGSSNGIAGDDLMVLLAQVTTDGLIEGVLNLQVFVGGNPFDEQLETWAFSAGASGCTDQAACNYNSTANANDGSCVFPDSGYTCEGECALDSDEDGVCDEFEIAGCPDIAACNYALGITDLEACDYPELGFSCDGDCLADIDGDGVCDPLEIDGCTDPSSCNFMTEATDDDGSCVFADPFRNCLGACLLDADEDGICDEEEVVGCTALAADNYSADATDDDGSCLYTGCMDESACDYDAAANVSGQCSYAAAEYDCAGNCLSDADGDGVCDALEISGCTNVLAENFNPLATQEDGTCDTLPSSYCGLGTVWDDEMGQCVGDGGIGGYGGSCFGDFDGNGSRTVSDLLLWLPFYDTSCD
tara:strand:- start:2409 stop:3968 length:1560 start_codon:yes stop_codon:yes gene_type:complete